MTRCLALAAALLLCRALAAQQLELSETFQGYGIQATPLGWTGPFRTARDPLDASNTAFAVHERAGFSTLTSERFGSRFEFRGRMLRTSDDARPGIVFFSTHPERDAFYLIALDETGGGKRRSVRSQSLTTAMRLTARGGGAPAGTLDSEFTPDVDRWYDFAIEADEFDHATHIRARFWPSGTIEPAAWQIEARDSSIWRLAGGRIGVWSGSAHGEVYFDDLTARSAGSEQAPPAIKFFDAATQAELDPSKLALFKQPARINVRVTGHDAPAITLDGVEYTGAAIDTDGLHQIAVQAGFVTATLRLLVDQRSPLIEVLANGTPLIEGKVFDRDVLLDAKITDVSSVTVTSSIGGLPMPIAEESAHTLTITAVDQVGWESSATASLTIDKTAPQIAILGNGIPFLSGHTFNADVTLNWSAADATLDTVTATLNGQPVQPGVIVSAAQAHALAITATDRAGHTTRAAREFVLRKNAPEVRLFANGAPLTEKTFGTNVILTAEILDAGTTTYDASLNDGPYTFGTPIGSEGLHRFRITVRNDAGLETSLGPFNFTVDLTPPVLALTESSAPFTDGMKFNRDVLPLLTATDNLTSSPGITLLVDGREYPRGAAVTEERLEHTIAARATDDAGHTATIGPFRFLLDKTRPIVTIVEPSQTLYGKPVQVQVKVDDLTETTLAATLGGARIDLNVPIAANGTHQLSVIATDAVGWQSDTAMATFTIDTLAPAIRFTSPAADAAVTTPSIEVIGFADDAVSITIADRPAQIDTLNRTFRAEDVPLLEGRNELRAVAVDRLGNSGTATLPVQLDTRAPELTITSPAANACLDATAVEVRGTVADHAMSRVKVNGADAALSNGGFVATVPFADEGRFTIRIEAIDEAGHVATASLPIIIDRTAPTIDILEGAEPFAATLLNRPVVLFLRSSESTTNAITLDGQPYVSGTSIGADGTHELKVIATDCAGHASTKIERFEIDRTAPAILTIAPQSGSFLGSKPRITGTSSSDATAIAVDPGGATHGVTNGTFTVNDAPLANGPNELRLTVTDRAGNRATETYRLTLDLTTPEVEITENGAAIAPNALFARDVTPFIRATERDATITATLNGNSFTSGTAITAAGAYTLSATATDVHGHTSAPATATFTIDRTPPAVDIVSPLHGAQLDDELVEVRGTVAGEDVQSLLVNGIATPVIAGAFTASVALDVGANAIIATAVDRAGNAASDQIEVMRGAAAPGIILTAPYDGMLTNRRTTVVAGQLLTPVADAKVTINGVEVAVDASGFFRVTGFALTEGENVITAAVANNQTSVRLTADLTPPRLRLLESGQSLPDGARFADRAVITVDSDSATQLLLDGAAVTAPVTIDEAGGHTLIATARDAAGNESRVERTIFIGVAGTGACRLGQFDPPNGTAVTSATVTISGRCGGASGVKVNGTAAIVANGSFCATVELAQEGDNVLTIACTGADGNETGDPQTLLIRRNTREPSIAFATPAEGGVSVSETIAATGTALGAATVEVNGALARFDGNSWSASNIRLAPGLNVLVARARSAAGRTTAVSRRVLYLKDAPALTITSPAPSVTNSGNSIDVSGGWTNLDPSTITVNGIVATATVLSDTIGTYVANVPLEPGDNTLTVTARDAAGRAATASIVVTHEASYPRVSITSPADNAVFSADSPETFTVSGTFTAAAGSTVEVAGEVATVEGTSFTATIKHSAGRVTPVLVRVTTPDGATAVDVIRVTKLAARPKVLEQFPAADAIDVDPGAMPLVLFSAPMDLASTAAAFRVETSAGSPVSGTLRLDRDVLTFAPAALLTAGERYTLRIAGTAKSIAGDALESPLVATFTTAPTAAPRPPTLVPTASACAPLVPISGTAPPSARLRIDFGTLTFTTTAQASGAWLYQLPTGGYSGYQVVRVRIVGSDGSLSPAAESCFLIDCSGPQIVSASYDRTANRIAIVFTKPVALTSDAVVLRLPDNRIVVGALSINGSVVHVTPSEDLTRSTFTLEVPSFAFTATFAFDADAPPSAGDGSGFVSGEVFDAATGRPLANADVLIGQTPLVTDTRGRYAAQLPEGPHTIRLSVDGYTTVWRQIVIPPGAGVIPIDVRLTPAASPIDGQSLPGLLPLGWSPLAAATAREAGTLDFIVPAAEITATAQVLTIVRYHDDRDEWRVLAAAANIVNGKVIVPVDEPGHYALVYPDHAPNLARPPTPASGAVLSGVPDVCANDACPPLVAESFVLDPPLVLPDGKSIATLTIDGTSPHDFPSGTAVQAYIDEELRLADGSRVTDPPFTADLLLYRNLAGTRAIARFTLGPSPRAAAVILDAGFDRIRILPYPGRVDRGALIGAEGGRVAGDGRVTVEIPAGAAAEAMRATSTTIDDVSSFESIDGFTIVSGFALTLQLARTVTAPEGLSLAVPELLQSARVTFPNVGAGQHILVEVLDGPRFRLAAQIESISGGRAATKIIDRATLPLDGVIREGRYLLLKANAPIVFATGLLRDGNGLYLPGAIITAPPLGVTDIVRVAGTYAVPVAAAPFTLVPSSPRTGSGAAYTHPTAPPPDAVVRVDLTLRPEPPHLLGTEPNATNVPLTPFVKAHFDADLDPASISQSSIVVTDESTQRAVAADVFLESPRTILWRLRGGENRLAPGTTYRVTIAPTIRARNGAPFGKTHSFRFTTIAAITSGEINAAKIRITIPDANGHSRVIGANGALPPGYIAVVTRRGRDFATPFQATSNGDGAFTIQIDERVELTDLIDLQVLNTARAIAAVIPLTPFVSEDRRGFIAPADRDVTFHGDLATITVRAHSFEQPALITTAPAAKSEFSAAPNFETELNFHAGLSIAFDGMAKHPLEVDIPIPAGTITDAKTFFLARIGDSIRGPRLEIDDALAISNGRFTTRDTNAAALRIASSGDRVKDHLLRLILGGTWAVVDFDEPVTFVGTSGLTSPMDLFWSSFQSLYCSTTYLAESRGRAVFPVLPGKAFTVEGVDTGTGFTVFTTAFDGVTAAPPGAFSPVASPVPNESGPYPVFARPLFVHVADLYASDVRQFPVPGLQVELPSDRGEAVITRTSAAPEEFGVLNVRSGDFRPLAASPSRSVMAEFGDRVVVFGSAEVEAVSRLELAFNEALGLDAANAANFIVLEQQSGSAWVAVPVDYELDSGGRRVWINLRGELQRGGSYRVLIRRTLSDAAPDPRPLGVDLMLPFRVRASHGELHSFELTEGSVRDLALDGNLLFVAATEGDLVAYDVSDPASLGAPHVRASNIPGDTWSVSVDGHGRVWTTAMTDTFGVIRSFRVEEFASGGPVAQVAATIVSWRPGINASLPLGTTFLIRSDRAEAIPRKMQVATQDETFEAVVGDFFLDGNPLGATASPTGSSGDFIVWNVTIPRSANRLTRRQRVTVRNETAQLRWSADIAEGAASATLANVLARPGDKLVLMRNFGTYAVVTLLGYGIAVYDLEAVEHNRRLPVAATPFREQLALTDARDAAPCDEAVQPPGFPCGPRALTFTNDAVVVPGSDARLDLFALETRKGPVHVSFDGEPRRETHLALSGSFNSGGQTAFNDHPRLAAIRDRFRAAGRPLTVRFTGMARFGRYALIAASSFGILVVDLTPPLDVESLADVIWVPAGAYGVRHIAGSHYATAIDGEGRSLLIDLSRVDERAEAEPGVLFPTAARALAAGADDPRIIWKSDADSGVALPPVGDPDTGFLFSGEGKTMRVLSALDPRLRVQARLGGAMRDVSAVVPLGIRAPEPYESGELGAVRLEVALPGSMSDGTPSVRIDSERLPGVTVSTTDLPLHRVVPASNGLRFQKGWNVFVSDPIVVIADPRAAKSYEPKWNGASLAEKVRQGCFTCERPEWARGADALEIHSDGRELVVRYAWLSNRIETRLGTIMADTVRPALVRVAAQNPPVAGGLLQETTYLHSGELETAAVDLDAGGRAGWNVAIDRTYRSRTIGSSPLGTGWDSALFRRLRVLPREVEYRDGAETWMFTPDGRGGYVSPPGLRLKLTRTDGGFTLIDQQWRVTSFDTLGRVIAEADDFVHAEKRGSGNVIRYAYDDRDRLVEVIDPVGRRTRLSYGANGLLSEIVDWRGRTIRYAYSDGALTEVRLPAAKAAEGVPAEFDHSASRIQYAYDGEGRLSAIVDPGEVSSRVRFRHAGDRVVEQSWATGEHASFAYSDRGAVVEDALGQKRTYGLDGAGIHAHIVSLREHDVPVIAGDAAAVDLVPEAHDLDSAFEYDADGRLVKTRGPNGLEVVSTFDPASSGAPGKILKSVRESGPALAAITTGFGYDDRGLAVNTVASITRAEEGQPAPLPREMQQPNRDRLEVVEQDEDLVRRTRYDEAGLLRSSVTSNAAGTESRKTTIDYYSPSLVNPLIAGRPFRISSGDGELLQTFAYAAAAAGGEAVEVTDNVRGTVTKTLFDSFGRRISERVTGSGGEVLADERFGYDAAGRLAYHTRRQKPLGLVETRIRYDLLGREIERSTTNASVDGALTTLVAKTDTNLAGRTITRFDAAPDGATAAREIVRLDGLGRPISVERLADSGPRLFRVFGYDINGQRSYETDTVRTATLRKHDLLGRETLVISSDGTSVESVWSAWNEPLRTIVRDAAGVPVTHTKRIFTSKGRLRAVNDELSHFGPARQTRLGWEGERTTTTRVGAVDSVEALVLPDGVYRTAQTERDLAGRVRRTKLGEAANMNGLITEAQSTFAQTETSYAGGVPSIVITSEPRFGASYTTQLSHDSLGRTTAVAEAGGAYVTRTVYDEAGNVIESQRPGMNAERTTFDARGLPLSNVMADGKEIRHRYDALGIVRERIDEAGERTAYDTDALGRVVKVRYADGSFEETVYEDLTGAVKATRDRGGQWLSYLYDGGGRVLAIRNGPDPSTAPDLVQYRYDAAGRLLLAKNKDAGIGFESYDFLGRPQITRAYRYRAGSGLSASPDLLDVHTQTHAWSIHDGERTRWRMPAAGSAPPNTDDPSSRWLQTIVETRDAGANLIRQEKASGEVLADAFGRSAGRISLRKRGRITTEFGFADGGDVPSSLQLPPPSAASPRSGLPLWSATSSGDVTLAGAANVRDGARRLSMLHDVSGRFSAWRYDDRGRMTESWLLKPAIETPPMTHTLIDADFRSERFAPSLFTDAQRTLLGPAVAELEPSSWTQTKTPTLHQIATRTTGTTTHAYDFDQAGRRTSDGVWASTFDEFGRVTSMSSADLGRRIEYTYDPNNRLAGRIALMPDGAGAWILETRTNVLARDGLPADTTFVWDPLVDRLLAIYSSGASTASGATPESGLLRQYLHGDQSYDDPLYILTPTETYLPILDQAGAGSITALATPDGHLAERILYADPYGDAPRYLHGPIVDRVAIELRKNSSGTVAEAKVRVHLSDAIDPATLPPGLRLAAVRADGTPVFTSPIPPTLEDRFTALWTLSAPEWTALTTAPGTQFIEVAVHRDLRCSAWNAPVLPIPLWATKLYPGVTTTPTHPVIVRYGIASLHELAASIGAGGTGGRVGWEVGDWYGVGVGEGRGKVFTGVKGEAFVEAATGLTFLRSRWYDPATGSFLTPDTIGYGDSSNLYAYCSEDPVGCSDPTGEAGIRDTTSSLLGWGVGVVETAGETIHTLNPIVSNYRTFRAAVPRAKRVVAAYDNGGLHAGAKQYVAEVKNHTAGMVEGLPIINTVRQAAAISESYEVGSFEGGRQVGRTTFGLAGDATLIYGGVKGTQAVRASRVPITAYNARTSPRITEAVLDHIDPARLNADARFGPAVYVAEQGATAVTEVAYHGAKASHVIRYNLHLGDARVLDLTHHGVARQWGYQPTNNYVLSQQLALAARQRGYNVIKFKSQRGPGANFAILDDFDALLRAQGVSPSE